MSRPTHLRRRGNQFYYHRRVPLALVGRLGTPILSFSLGTADPKDAAKRRDLEDLKYNARFEKLLAAPSDAPPGKKVISTAEIMEMVRDYVEAKDKRAIEASLSVELTDEDRQDDELQQGILKDNQDPNCLVMIYQAGSKILGEPPDVLDHDVSLFPFMEVVRRGLLELQDRKLLRYGSEFSKTYVNPMFAPSIQKSATFAQVASQHLQLVEQGATAKGTNLKWVDQQRANIALLNEIIGPGTPIHMVDFDRCMAVRATLAAIPAGRAIRYRGVSLAEAIRLCAVHKRPHMSPVTQEGYLFTFRNIMSLAAKKRLITGNPAEGLSTLQRETLKSKDRRLPLTPEQLKQFFEGNYYKNCAHEHPDAPYKADPTGWRFWLPILALFQGMRANEICQLNVADIQRTALGTWFISVACSDDEDESSGKQLKTETSYRKIPVHPEIMALGFIEFVNTKRLVQISAKLFPTLKQDKYGYFSKYPLKRFRETFFPEELSLQRRQSFHSLRHNFRDALRRAGADRDALQAIGGWSKGGAVSDNYGDAENPDMILPEIAKVAFPGLDLSRLHQQMREMK